MINNKDCEKYYIHLRSGIYVTFYANHLILLDTDTDSFYISPDISQSDFTRLFINNYTIDEHHDNCVSRIINNMSEDLLKNKLTEFYDNGFLAVGLHRQPMEKFFKANDGYNQYTNIDWRLNNHKFVNSSKSMTTKFIYLLAKVHSISRLSGFKGIIRTIHKGLELANKKYTEFKIPEDKDLAILVDSLNAASLIFPVRTKCLEWAASLVLMALKNGWPCSLVVGVQSYPFASHAWVECNGKVLADVESLPDNLAVIMREPVCYSQESMP